MLWNRDSSVTVAGKLRAFFSPASITFRLTWLYSLTAFSMLFLYAFFMYSSLLKSLDRKDAEDIGDEANHIVNLLKKNNPAFLEQYTAMIEWDKAGHTAKNARHHARVLDEAGHMISQSPFFYTLGPLVFPAASSQMGHPVKWKSADGRSFLLLTIKAQKGIDSVKTRIIQVAMDISQNDALIADYHDKLIGSLFAGIFLCAAIGFSVARKTLRPLGVITEATERITVSQIAERLNPERWPTELRNLSVALNSMLDRLEQSIIRLSQISTDLAHELRTPINNFLGEAEIALFQERPAEEYRKVLISGIEECERLSRLINSLLFLAQAENPSNSVTRDLFDPVKVIQDLISLHGWKVKEKDAKLTCHGYGMLNGDPILFHRAVSNLLTNALNYAPHGVKIDICVKLVEDHYLEVVVSDTGYGIAKEELPRIFDRFYRIDGSRSNYPEGSGLGLSIVRAIMDLHGGLISVDSKLGQGTKVILRFPASDFTVLATT